MEESLNRQQPISWKGLTVIGNLATQGSRGTKVVIRQRHRNSIVTLTVLPSTDILPRQERTTG